MDIFVGIVGGVGSERRVLKEVTVIRDYNSDSITILQRLQSYMIAWCLT